MGSTSPFAVAAGIVWPSAAGALVPLSKNWTRPPGTRMISVENRSGGLRRPSSSAGSGAYPRHRPDGPSGRDARTYQRAPLGKSRPGCHSVRSTRSPEFFLPFPNAGSSAEEGDLQDVVITHPFHPLRGRTVRIYDRVGGCKRAIVRYFADGPAGATPCQRAGFLDVPAAG